MEELMEILKNARPDVDFENEEALIDDGILTEVTGNKRNRVFALYDYINVFN